MKQCGTTSPSSLARRGTAAEKPIWAGSARSWTISTPEWMAVERSNRENLRQEEQARAEAERKAQEAEQKRKEAEAKAKAEEEKNKDKH